MDLPAVWFCVIALFWLGYLFLEGFDFGVGMLLPVLGRTETEWRVLINTIGSAWDGNEVPSTSHPYTHPHKRADENWRGHDMWPSPCNGPACERVTLDRNGR
jgi:hypothetical protein